MLLLEERGEVVCKNGAVYKGQWYGNMSSVATESRSGLMERAMKAIGKHNKACGKGKFWHVDGGMYLRGSGRMIKQMAMAFMCTCERGSV